VATYGIVFSGGGALGAWEVGCYDAIKAKNGNANPIIVAGASAGALNAVGVCTGMSTPELTRLWAGLKRDDVCELRLSASDLPSVGASAVRNGVVPALLQYLGRYDSLYSTKKLARTLRTILSPHIDNFLNSSTYLAISVTNLVNNAREFFYKLPPGAGSLPQRAADHENARWNPIRNLDQLIDALLGSTALPILFPPRAQYFDEVYY
jgi:predicted acylesterase/phospholipase RssA